MALLWQVPELPAAGEGWLGWLRTFVLLLSLSLTAWAIYRSKSSEVLKGELEAYKGKCQRLETEKTEVSAAKTQVEAAKAQVEKELADCHAKTDLTKLMEQHRQFHVELLGAMTRVASGNDDRYDRTIHSFEQSVREIKEALIKRLDDQSVAMRALAAAVKELHQA